MLSVEVRAFNITGSDFVETPTIFLNTHAQLETKYTAPLKNGFAATKGLLRASCQEQLRARYTLSYLFDKTN